MIVNESVHIPLWSVPSVQLLHVIQAYIARLWTLQS